tara:strand:+ start:313 stop:771 length:459 start_codon:yes stop_codon:yes gene_type:complete
MDIDKNIPSNLKKLKDNIDSLKDKINLYKYVLNEITSDVSKIENNFNNFIKSYNKPKNKKVQRGFTKPTNISNDLATFMNLSNNQLVSRSDVTKFINQYIKNNNLQDPNNKKNILPDSKLSSILDYNLDNNEAITYFSIQKHLNKHFVSFKN